MNLSKFVFILFLGFGLLACNKEVKSNDIEIKLSKEVSLKNVEVSIEGMTCEIGCAKLIESKTHKLDGMSFAKVSFEHKMGQFTYDSDILTIADIEKHINGIAGGELYKVTSTTFVDEFTKWPSSAAVVN